MSIFFNNQMFIFGIIGIGGMIVDFFITWLCKEKCKLNKYVSNSLGFCYAVINNFLLNKSFNFHQNTQSFEIQFAKFTIIAIIGLGINNLILYSLGKYFKINFYFLKLGAICITFFWNYLMNLFFTFANS
jgi:putative flippase GtrA